MLSTMTEERAEQPLVVVTTTVYSPLFATVAFEITGFSVLAVKPFGPVQEKLLALTAFA